MKFNFKSARSENGTVLFYDRQVHYCIWGRVAYKNIKLIFKEVFENGKNNGILFRNRNKRSKVL